MARGGGKPGTRVLDTWSRDTGVLVETRTIGHLVPALTKLGPLLRKLQIILLGWAGLGWAGVLVLQEGGGRQRREMGNL